MVGAGLILDKVQYWPAFRCIPEIMIVVPPLLGLKGNLEMTLAARMSTASNLGLLKDKQVAISTIFGNLVLVQCQGIACHKVTLVRHTTLTHGSSHALGAGQHAIVMAVARAELACAARATYQNITLVRHTTPEHRPNHALDGGGGGT